MATSTTGNVAPDPVDDAHAAISRHARKLITALQAAVDRSRR